MITRKLRGMEKVLVKDITPAKESPCTYYMKVAFLTVESFDELLKSERLILDISTSIDNHSVNLELLEWDGLRPHNKQYLSTLKVRTVEGE